MRHMSQVYGHRSTRSDLRKTVFAVHEKVAVCEKVGAISCALLKIKLFPTVLQNLCKSIYA